MWWSQVFVDTPQEIAAERNLHANAGVVRAGAGSASAATTVLECAAPTATAAATATVDVALSELTVNDGAAQPRYSLEL